MKWNFLNNIEKVDIRTVLFSISLVLFFLLLNQCNATKNAKTELAQSKQNIFALTDTIKVVVNKANELQFEKGMLITSEKGLRDLNAELYKELKKQSSDIAFLQKIVAKITTQHTDIISGTGNISGNPCDSIGKFVAEWEVHKQFDSINYRSLKANTEITVNKREIKGVSTNIINDEIGIGLITGIKENREGNFEIFVKSNYPGFVPTKIEGAFIPRKELFPPEQKKNWSVGIGPQAGVGIGGTTSIGPVWYIGLGASLQYSFIKF